MLASGLPLVVSTAPEQVVSDLSTIVIGRGSLFFCSICPIGNQMDELMGGCSTAVTVGGRVLT